MQGYGPFEFKLLTPLVDQIFQFLKEMDDVSLSAENVEDLVKEEQGVYLLLLNGVPVYVGKTDDKAGLKCRLSRHAKKILHRRNLDPTLVSFKSAKVATFTPVAIEEKLIALYKKNRSQTFWNGSGFGSNDPGRERDTSKPGDFDSDYPIDIDIPLSTTIIQPGEQHRIDQALENMRTGGLPYVIRYQKLRGGGRPHEDLSRARINIEQGQTTRQILESISSVLNSEWQITILPGLVIMYCERKEYRHSLEVIRGRMPAVE